APSAVVKIGRRFGLMPLTPRPSPLAPHPSAMPPLALNSTLGVLGGGQLGQMFATAAQSLGYRVHVYCPESDCPAAQVADEHTVADYHDFQAIAQFAQSIDAATLEFENVPVAAAEAAAHYVPVRPAGETLYTVQDRSRE